MKAARVRIDQPELLEAVFGSLGEGRETRQTSAALSQASKAWLAASRACGPSCPSKVTRTNLDDCKRWLALRPAVRELCLELTQRHAAIESSDEDDIDAFSNLEPQCLITARIVQDQARGLLQVAAGRLHKLDLACVYDTSWLPSLPVCTELSFRFIADASTVSHAQDLLQGRSGPVDRRAAASPRLEQLGAEIDGFGLVAVLLGKRAALPPALRGLSLAGDVQGMEPAFRQLEALAWSPSDTHDQFSLGSEALEALAQASRLTELHLCLPHADSMEDLFACLGAMTQLPQLSISHYLPEYDTVLSPDYWGDPEEHAYVVHDLLGPTLGALSRLTRLALNGHGLDELPVELALMPVLASLDVTGNEGLDELPHGPWSSLQQLRIDAEVLEDALDSPPPAEVASEGGQAAGRQPGWHTLWSMTGLAQLTVCSADASGEGGGLLVEDVASRQAQVLALLPRLQKLEM